VVDVTSPDITCRKDATPPALTAKARAGSQMKFQWSNYFTSHKGPVLTVSFRDCCAEIWLINWQYMGRMDSPNMKVQQVKFFKIDENNYDPKTHDCKSENLHHHHLSVLMTFKGAVIC
jgi:lytic cellulose monooxygenase (C1-hydroxylating)